MPLDKLNPTSPGTRHQVRVSFKSLSPGEKIKSLYKPLKKTGGRNNRGVITARHRGGGSKRHMRIIDFKREKEGIPGIVQTIQYDPNRSAFIALINYNDGERRYILAPDGLEIGAKIQSGPNSPIALGNTLPLKIIPSGTVVHNIELVPRSGGKIARSAGNAAQVLAREGDFVLIRLPSGETRRLLINCNATIGQVSNLDHKNASLGKAGRKRHLGIRPRVRGSAMTPRDHPHGGGEGRSPIGLPSPKTPWGKPTLGYKTRKKNKSSDKFIVQRRK